MVHCCPVEPVEKAICEDELAQAHMARLLVLGLVCPNCAVHVRNALLRLDGVLSVDVDWHSGLAFVDFVPSRTNPHLLIRAVSQMSAGTQHNFQAAVIP
jgi:copper chaperone CopZ